MKKTSIRISKNEFLRWLNKRGNYKEFTEKQYKTDLKNWSAERGEESTSISEYCYLISLGNNYCLKFYSSIDKGTNLSRERGEDSLKIVVADETSLEPKRGRLKHAERIIGWGNNLDTSVIQGLEALWGKELVSCTKCRGGKLIVKKRTRDGATFLGCRKFKTNTAHDTYSLQEIWRKDALRSK